MEFSAFLFAFLAGLAAGSYSIFQKLASGNNLPPAFGAMIISFVAFWVNFLIFLGMKSGSKALFLSKRAFFFLIFAGLAAAGIDFFSLSAYKKGLPLIASFLITGISAVVIVLTGFFVFREVATLGKCLGVFLILIGLFLLRQFGF